MHESTLSTSSVTPPTGRVTLVFTDVQGSTNLWERHTDAMRAALTLHNQELRQLLAQSGGYEVKTEGDAFMLAFTSPESALRWCLAAQETLLGLDWPHELLSHEDACEAHRPDGTLLFRGLRVRMGLHTGEPECRPDPVTGRMDYFGPMVNRAARIASAAHGGQIVVGADAWKALEPRLAELGVPEARELGTFHFKGLLEPETLVQVLPRTLGDRAFPPPKAQDVKKTNLVPNPSRFIGREHDLRRLKDLFAEGSRLITLLGPGGTGKTRLSQQFAVESPGEFEGGMWFCDLTEATTVEGICEAVAAALDIPLAAARSDADMVRRIGDALAGRSRTLVILDNFEQLVDHAAATVGQWLKHTPQGAFLVSSRELLRLPGEVAYELSPLGLPNDQDIAGSEAVQLFVERVRSVRQDYELTDGEAATVAEIVRQLDGIPLAIELAAARMGVLSAAKLLERLPRRFDLLSSGRRDASARQATLKGLIDWSWNLLQPWEQAALMQCSVFRGGFTLEAAEAVLDLSDYPDAPWTMDVVQSLREKSLLKTQPCSPEPRFGMYLSIWDYAHLKLEAAGPADAVRDRHAAYYMDMAQHARGILTDPKTLPRLAIERENFHEIHGRASAISPPTAESVNRTLQAALALDPVQTIRGPFGPHFQLLDHALRHAELPGVSAALRGRALDARGRCNRLLGKMAESLQDHQQALSLAIETGDMELEAVSNQMIGLIHQNTGALAEAKQCYDRALAIAQTLPVTPYEGRIMMAMGYLHLEEGQPEKALPILIRAVELLHAIGDERFEGIARSHQGYVLLELGRNEEAYKCFEEAIRLCRNVGDRRFEGIIYGTYADQAFLEWRLDDALLHYERSLAMLREVGELRFEKLYMCRKGGVLAAMDQLAEAERVLERVGANLSEAFDPVNRTVMALHAAQLQLARARAAQAAGGYDVGAWLADIQSLLKECEDPGPATPEHPNGQPSKVSQSDEIRLSVRMLRRDLARR